MKPASPDHRVAVGPRRAAIFPVIAGVLVILGLVLAASALAAAQKHQLAGRPSGASSRLHAERRLAAADTRPDLLVHLLGPGDGKAPEGKGKGKPPAKGKVPAGWYLDYAEAKAQARQTGKPLFVIFH